MLAGLREGWNETSEFESDGVAMKALVIELRRFRRGFSGGLGGCVRGREIQSGTP